MPVYELFNQRQVVNAIPPLDYMQCSLDVIGCTCSESVPNPDCVGEFAFVPYGDLCRKLGFDPRHDIFSHLDSQQPLAVLFPWDELNNPWSAPPWDSPSLVKPQEAYGNKSDYETESKPFGWVDHVQPVLLVPVHHYTSSRMALFQIV
jgi:hypothetical protein